MPRKPKQGDQQIEPQVDMPKELMEVIKSVSDGYASQRLTHLFKKGALSKMESSLDIAEQFEFCYLLLVHTDASGERIRVMLNALDGVSKHFERFTNKEQPAEMLEKVKEIGEQDRIILETLKEEDPKMYNKIKAKLEKHAQNSSK